MNTNEPRSTAKAVHQKNMAYKDVVDAALPIRWTTQRRDLFLLETIHRNWSSERWRQNIDERMKSLTLHYNRLEDERRHQEDERRQQEDERRQQEDERRRNFDRNVDEHRRVEDERRRNFDRNLALGGLFLTTFVLVSAIADLIHLYDKWHSLKKVAFYGIGLPALIVVLVAGVIWLWSKLRPQHQNQEPAPHP